MVVVLTSDSASILNEPMLVKYELKAGGVNVKAPVVLS